MIDYTVGTFLLFVGWLYVDTQYPDEIHCDTCDYFDDDDEKKIKFPLAP